MKARSAHTWMVPRTAAAFALASCLLLCSGCAQGQPEQGSAISISASQSASASASAQEQAPVQAFEDETFSEGVDTACSVSYAPYAGEFGDLFLQEGDRIAVIAPSSVPSIEQVDATMAGLRSWGYVPVAGAHVYEREVTLDACREDLLWALEDPSIKAVFCVRGGYGASEVQDTLALEQISGARKLIVGYSDISVYHSAWSKLGLPSVHACMSATFSELLPECVEAERRLLQAELPSYTCTSNEYCRPGEATGKLVGGNLATLTATLGTAYDCTQTDEPYILFLEDVDENLSHLHRYLTILKHLGVLDRAAGIVFGEWTDVPTASQDYVGNSRGGSFASVADMIAKQILPGIEAPVAFGFPAGHSEANYPLLMGATARLTVSDNTFSLSWV